MPSTLSVRPYCLDIPIYMWTDVETKKVLQTPDAFQHVLRLLPTGPPAHSAFQPNLSDPEAVTVKVGTRSEMKFLTNEARVRTTAGRDTVVPVARLVQAWNFRRRDCGFLPKVSVGVSRWSEVSCGPFLRLQASLLLKLALKPKNCNSDS